MYRLSGFLMVVAVLLAACKPEPTVSPLPVVGQSAVSPLAAPTRQPTPAARVGLELYTNKEGGFSIGLPPGWTVSEPQSTPLGNQYTLGPASSKDNQGRSTIIVADANKLSVEQAIKQLCGGCAQPPAPDDALLGRIETQLAVVSSKGSPTLEWRFVLNQDKLIFFSIHDPQTLEPLDAIIHTFTFDPVLKAEESTPAVQAARNKLAEQLGVNPYTIVVSSAEHVQWPDTCLGAAMEKEMCAEAVTPGYQGILQTRQAKYEFHTNETGDAVRFIPGAALIVQQTLAQQLQINPRTIKIVSIEKMMWPDGCLGIRHGGQMCTQVITPGYKVVLAVEGRRYTYHTDEQGSQARLADAPAPDVKNAIIAWTLQTDETCLTAAIGEAGVMFGQCGGQLMAGRLLTDMGRSEDLSYFKTFAPFRADTPAGTVVLTGTGKTVATPAEQRMVAEWASLVSMEASSGRSGASHGLIFAWHREGGIAGFCDDISVYVTGDAYASSCKGNQPKNLGRRRLDAAQLEKVYGWLDRLESFEINQKDAAQADAMTIRLLFNGAGEAKASEADVQAISTFAAEVLGQIQ